MDMELSPAQRVLRDEVRAFAETTIAASAARRSDSASWDSDLWHAIGARGWPGVVIPRQHGGMGAGALEHALIVEEVSRVDASIGAALNLLQQTVMAVLSFATPAQQAHYLPLLASGQSYSITGITESESGSKMTDMHSVARREGNGWVLNGTKTEVHIPQHVQICLVFAKTPCGISAFLVDTATEGFRVVAERGIVGLRGLPMAAVAFDDCRLPAESLLGREGGAYDVFFKSFDLTRIGNAAKCTGIGAGALDRAIAYAKTRRIGDNVVTDFQGIRWQIAELDARLESGRLLTWRAAQEYATHGRSTLNSARAKLIASKAAMDATTTALQITGSYGCFSEQPFARYMMDAKLSEITGGTVEILKNAIARDLLGKPTAPTA
jgi:alkylation response protein AidB-like acyl-CoA dehydrogenase